MMGARFFSTFTLLVTLASNAFAGTQSTCPTVTLDRNGGTAANIPVWNQKKLPACYSFTASFLATVWIREEWAKGNSGLLSFLDDPKRTFKFMRGSPEFETILDADRGRTCQATDFILRQKRSMQADPSLPFYTSPRCEMWGFQKDSANAPNVLREPVEFENQMHSLLESEQRPLPFAIEFCSFTFKYPGRSLITKRTFRSNLAYINDDQQARENLDKECGFHAAVVTGQAMRNGVCHFRVRNSAGDFDGKNIEDGYFWIPASDLAKNTLRVITLQHE